MLTIQYLRRNCQNKMPDKNLQSPNKLTITFKVQTKSCPNTNLDIPSSTRNLAAAIQTSIQKNPAKYES